MESLTFNLLLSDGFTRVTFQPALKPCRYEAFLTLVKEADDTVDLAEQLRMYVSYWGVVRFSIESPSVAV